MTEVKDIAKGKIGNALTSTAANHVTAVSADVYDEEAKGYQSEINKETTERVNDLALDVAINESINTKSYNSAYSSSDLDVADEDGNVIMSLEDGHIKTKNFDSHDVAPKDATSSSDLDVADEDGNVIMSLEDGHIKTKNFDSHDVAPKDATSSSDLDVADEDGNVIMSLEDGHIKTKNFDSHDAFVPRTIPKLLYQLNLNDLSDVESSGWTNNETYLTNIDNLSKDNALVVDKEFALKDSKFIIEFRQAQIGGVTYIGAKNGIDALNNSSLIGIDFANSQIKVYNRWGGTSVKKTISFNSVANYNSVNFAIEIQCLYNHRFSIKLTNLSNGVVLADEVLDEYIVGLFRDKLAIYSEGGVTRVYNIFISTNVSANGNCALMIMGDSITEGYISGTDDINDTYSCKIQKLFANGIVKISGRCGGTIVGGINRLNTEGKVLKPQYVMATFGTNQNNAAGQSVNTVENYVAFMDKVDEIGAIPILNHIPCLSTSIQSSTNAVIDEAIRQYRTKGKICMCCRMDDATAIGGDVANGADANLINATDPVWGTSDGVHPNKQGHDKMFKRFFRDIPFFNN